MYTRIAKVAGRVDFYCWIIMLAVAVLCWGLLTSMREAGQLQGLEMMVFDAQVRVQPPSRSFSDRFLLVAITESDIQALGYPVSDGDLAKALEILLAGRPAVIGVDLFRDLPGVGREQLRRTVEQNGNIVVVEKRLGEPVSLPEFELHKPQRAFTDLQLDHDGRVRRGLLMMWDEQGEAHYSLPLQLVLQYLKPQNLALQPDPEDKLGVVLGEGALRRFRANDGSYRRADDGGYQLLMDYGLGHLMPKRVSLTDVLEGKLEAGQVAGRIVVIGMVAGSTQDRHETPLSSGWTEFPAMDGIVLHTQLAEQMLRIAGGVSPSVQSLSRHTEWWLAGLFGVLGAALGALSGRLSTQLLLFAAGSLSILAAGVLGFQWQWWWPAVYWTQVFALAFVGAGLWMGQRERREKRIVMQLFGKYASPEVADMLWQHRGEFMDGHRPKPQRLVATVLITDLQGFTGPTSQMQPVQVMEWINRYMEAMTEVAIKHGGFVDDYAGDGLKVDFGVPIARQADEAIAADAVRAVECALEMGQLVTELNRLHRDDPPLRLRAGINTGDLVAGSVGSSQRMKYTTVGDTVNTAARLESFDKETFQRESDAHFRLLVSNATREFLGNRFLLRSMGFHVLKGHEMATGIHRVLRKNDARLQLLEAV